MSSAPDALGGAGLVGAAQVYASLPHRVKKVLDLATAWPNQSESPDRKPVKIRTARQLRIDEVDALVIAFRGGATVAELAATFHVYRTTIGQHLRSRGIDTKYFALSPDELREAVQLYGQGWTIADLAARYEVGNETIRARLVADGITIRSRGRRRKIA